MLPKLLRCVQKWVWLQMGYAAIILFPRRSFQSFVMRAPLVGGLLMPKRGSHNAHS